MVLESIPRAGVVPVHLVGQLRLMTLGLCERLWVRQQSWQACLVLPPRWWCSREP